MEITVTVLKDDEIKCCQSFFNFFDELEKLGKRRSNVYARLEQLKMLLPKDIKIIEENLKRITRKI